MHGQDNRRLLEANPAVMRSDWLPAGLHPSLDEIRGRHGEMLAAYTEASGAMTALKTRFEDEDERELEAATQGSDPPERTPEAERREALRVARVTFSAAEQRFCDCVREAVEEVQSHEREWQADLDLREQGSKAIAEEARQTLARAELEVRRLIPMRHWIYRTAKAKDGFHVPIAELGVPDEATVIDPAQMLGMVDEPDLTPRKEDDLGPDQETEDEQTHEEGSKQDDDTTIGVS